MTDEYAQDADLRTLMVNDRPWQAHALACRFSDGYEAFRNVGFTFPNCGFIAVIGEETISPEKACRLLELVCA